MLQKLQSRMLIPIRWQRLQLFWRATDLQQQRNDSMYAPLEVREVSSTFEFFIRRAFRHKPKSVTVRAVCASSIVVAVRYFRMNYYGITAMI